MHFRYWKLIFVSFAMTGCAERQEASETDAFGCYSAGQSQISLTRDGQIYLDGESIADLEIVYDHQQFVLYSEPRMRLFIENGRVRYEDSEDQHLLGSVVAGPFGYNAIFGSDGHDPPFFRAERISESDC